MNLEPEKILTKTPQGINASRSGVGMSPKAHTLLKLFDGTMSVVELKRLCLAQSLSDGDYQIALKELLQLEHVRIVDPAASAKSDAAAAAEAERKLSLTLDFTPWSASEPASAPGKNSANPVAPAQPAARPAPWAGMLNSPAQATVRNTAAAALRQDTLEDKSARLKQEAEVRQKLITALQPKVEEELRSRLRPKLEQELRPKLIAALRPGVEAEIRTALTKELAPRVELELKARMAKTLAAQKVAEQQAAKAAPVADVDERDKQPAAVTPPAAVPPPPPGSTPVADSGNGGLERVLASLNLPVFSIDKMGVCTYMSPAWVQFSGYTAAEVVGKPLVDFFAEGNRRAMIGMLTGIANGTALRFEQLGELLRKGSGPLWVEISAAPLYAASGQPVGVCGAIRDAAESQRMADQAEADGVRLLLLVDQIDTGVILEDREGNVQQANPAVCTLLSLDAASYSLEGMPVAELHATAAKGFIGPEGFLRRVAEIRAAGTDAKGESFVMADGRVISQDYLEVTVGNDSVGHLWLYRDMPRPQARSAT
jgi:PAS domain S-box-containing protein